ncbi:MAG: FAD-dependent monooxygenase [Pseudomonadales bacterium]
MSLSESTSLHVLIAGGGIGGLTAALTLAQNGCRVSLFEQAKVFSETGAGLQLSPNASRVLHDLGLESALQHMGFLPEGTQFRHWRTGRVIAESELGAAVTERYGAPYYHLHRGDLLSVLVTAATAHSAITLHTDARVESFADHDSGVTLRACGIDHVGDLLVGADGIHSVARSALWGAQEPRFTGNVAWRAMVPSARLPKDLIRPMSTVWWGPGKHFVHYYVRGGAFVNCVCVVEKSGWEVESWTEPGDHAELKADFRGWHDDIVQLLDQADRDSLFKWALYDRPPMAQWGRGRITLLGDACHPTLPFMAQGAAMAIEDAAVLAGCLVQDGPIVERLQRYETLRRPRTAGIQKGSRRNATVFHLSGVKAWLRNRAAGAARHRTMDTLFRYNALEAARSPVAKEPHDQSSN